MICLEPMPVPHIRGCTDRWGDEITTRIHDVCGRHWRATLWKQISKQELVSGYVKKIATRERGISVSRLENQFMDFAFEQNE